MCIIPKPGGIAFQNFGDEKFFVAFFDSLGYDKGKILAGLRHCRRMQKGKADGKCAENHCCGEAFSL